MRDSHQSYLRKSEIIYCSENVCNFKWLKLESTLQNSVAKYNTISTMTLTSTFSTLDINHLFKCSVRRIYFRISSQNNVGTQYIASNHFFVYNVIIRMCVIIFGNARRYHISNYRVKNKEIVALMSQIT